MLIDLRPFSVLKLACLSRNVLVCVHIFFKAAFGSFLALKRGSEVSEITHAEEILRIEPNLREGLLPGTFSVI